MDGLGHLLAGLDLKSAFDIGFAALVLFACLPNLLSDERKTEKRNQKWKEELQTLEETLRELIREAGSASSTLDRNLVSRRRELEALLARIETVKNSLTDIKGSRSQSSWSTEELPAFEDELPNESWNRPLAMRTQQEEDFGGGEQLEQLAAELRDPVALSRRPAVTREAPDERQLRQPSAAGNRPTNLATALAAQIEKINQNEDSVLLRTFAHLDPVAIRVAKRLLIGGQEIHLVARKLELPIADVRMLDRVIREEEELAQKHQVFAAQPVQARPEPPQFSAPHAERAPAKVEPVQPLMRRPTMQPQQSLIDQITAANQRREFEREMALL